MAKKRTTFTFGKKWEQMAAKLALRSFRSKAGYAYYSQYIIYESVRDIVDVVLAEERKKVDRRFTGKPFTITRAQWKKIRYGTILKTQNGVLRMNLNKSGRGALVFEKIKNSIYPNNHLTVYGYNDVCHTYKIVKY